MMKIVKRFSIIIAFIFFVGCFASTSYRDDGPGHHKKHHHKKHYHKHHHKKHHKKRGYRDRYGD